MINWCPRVKLIFLLEQSWFSGKTTTVGFNEKQRNCFQAIIAQIPKILNIVYASRLKKARKCYSPAMANKQFICSFYARESCCDISEAVFTSVKKSIFVCHYLVNPVSIITLRSLI